MDGDVAVVERPPGRRRRPPTITVSLQDGEPLLALSLEYDDHDTPQADIASEVVELARAAPWILPQPHLTTPSPEEAEEPSPHRLRSPAAALLEAHRPGPELARKLERTSLADADDATLVEVVAAWEREAAWAAAQQARAIAELGRRRSAGGPRSARSTVFEVEARLSVTRYAAEARVTTAEALEEFPAVADALAAGHIDLRKANVLLLEEWLSPDERRAVHDKLLPDADICTAPQLREMMRREALTANPAAAAKRHAKACAGREVRVEPAPDSMAWVGAYLRADEAETVRVVVDAMAHGAKAPGDGRTLPQLRADVFSDVFRRLADSGKDLQDRELPRLQRRSPHIQATGEFVALASRAYRPGADLTRTIIARDITCVFPGCRIPAWACEIDHIDSYDVAKKELVAQTDTHRCVAKCHGHHDVKTVGLWDSSRDPSTGEVTWTAPTGHQYVRRPVRPPGPPAQPADTGEDPPPF